MNTVVQVEQCNWSYWSFAWLRTDGTQTGWRRFSWTTWVGGIWPALAAIRSDQHPCLDTGWHADGISVTPTVSILSTEVNCEDGGWIYILAGVHCRIWAQKSVRSNGDYVISKYVLTDTFCMEKWQDRQEAHAITVISESVIMKFYCRCLPIVFGVLMML